jgi:DNA-binding NarL/FixJ family response regulator
VQAEEQPLRILLADDHPIFRHGLRGLLEDVPDVQVVGEATSGEEAVDQAGALAPDLVLMDVKMPGMNGIEASRRLQAICPAARILILTMFEDDATVFAALRAGARGYVLKDADREDLLRAIRAVARGEAIFSPAVASRVLDFFSGAGAVVRRESFPMLTDRERELLHALARGASNAQIAASLGLTAKTVSNYVSSILTKLQVADRAEAILRAREAGLG